MLCMHIHDFARPVLGAKDYILVLCSVMPYGSEAWRVKEGRSDQTREK